MSSPPWYTVGHSTRSVADLASLLRAVGVDLIADVRTVTRSRHNPQFNADTLPAALAEHGMAYHHLPLLGGLRSHRRNSPPSPNPFWENASFRNYADYALTPEFQAGLAELRALGRDHTCAIMCAEAVWWRCHRRIITDYLLAAGEPVRHVLGPGHVDPAAMTPAAHLQANGTLIYV